jgi:hypothetical protein
MAFEMCRKSTEHILGGDVRFAKKKRERKRIRSAGVGLACLALLCHCSEQSGACWMQADCDCEAV